MWRLKQWLKRIAQSWRRNQARYEAKKIEHKWSALAKRLPRSTDGKTLLHIGCSDINAPGFINLDARSQPHVHIVTTSLFRLKMIPDNVADLIYMSHVLEHVSHRDIIATLREMHRILKDGGVLRISVPDFDRIIDIYQATERDITAIEQPLMGGQDYAFNYHYAVFNDAHLRRTMLKSGFRETRTWDPQNCAYHDFDDWASRNISWGGREFVISVNIEAIK
jgi:predicted SAM-dependent methyltransferase